MAVKGAPVIITTKNGIPVRPVESGGQLLTVTDNGIGAPITVSERGAPFVVDGIGPSIYQDGPLYIAHRMSGLMYPEFSNDSYQCGYDAGLRQFEIDARSLSDGEVGIMHDATVDRTTDGTGNVSSFDATTFQALGIDYSSWFGGSYGTLHPPLASTIIEQFNGDVVFHIEGKDGPAMLAIIAKLDELGVRKDQYLLSSFSLTWARYALNAGYNAVVVANGSTDMNSIWDEGFRWVFMSGAETDSLISQYVDKGFGVLIYTYERRFDRDRFLALGVRGIYTDDAEYTQGDLPIATSDTWGTQKWMPGMIGWNSRGEFQSGGWWGWPTYVGVANMNMGWACPINGDEHANDFTISFDVRFNAVGAGTDWFAVWLADDATRDKLYSNSTVLPGAAGYFGYLVMFRQNGRIQIYKQSEATLTNIFTDGPAFTADGTTVYKVRVRVTPTQVIGEKIDSGGSVLQATTMTDSTFRGGYFSIHKLTNARMMFKDMVISPSGAIP